MADLYTAKDFTTPQTPVIESAPQETAGATPLYTAEDFQAPTTEEQPQTQLETPELPPLYSAEEFAPTGQSQPTSGPESVPILDAAKAQEETKAPDAHSGWEKMAMEERLKPYFSRLGIHPEQAKNAPVAGAEEQMFYWNNDQNVRDQQNFFFDPRDEKVKIRPIDDPRAFSNPVADASSLLLGGYLSGAFQFGKSATAGLPAVRGFLNDAERAAMRSKIGVADTGTPWWHDPMESLGDLWKKIIYQSLDKYYDARAIVSGARGKDSYKMTDMTPGSNVVDSYAYARTLQASVIETSEAALHKGAPFMTPDGQIALDRNMPSLKNVFEHFRSQAELEDSLYYMVAARAELLTQQGKEKLFTDAATLSSIVAKGNANPQAQELVRKLSLVSANELQFAVDNGVLSQAAKFAIIDKNPMFIPFYRLIEEGMEGAREGVNFSRNKLKGIQGSEELIGDPIENLVRNIVAITQMSLNNRAKVAVYDNIDMLANTGPQMAPWAVKLTPAELVSMNLGKSNVLVSDIKSKLNAMGIDASSITDDFLELWSLRNRAEMLKGPEPLDFVMRNGKAEYYRIMEPELLRFAQTFGPQAADAITRMPILGEIVRGTQFLKRTVTKIITTNPLYLSLVAAPRDTMSAYMNSQVGHIPIYDYLIGAARTTGASMGLSTAKNSKLYDEFLLNGGNLASWRAGSEDTTRLLMRGIMEKTGVELHSIVDDPAVVRRIWDVVKSAGRGYMQGVQALENAPRFQEFTKARKLGYNQTESAFLGRESVGDFAHHGANTFIKTMLSLEPFMQATLNATLRTARKLGENPQTVMLRGLAGIGGPEAAQLGLIHTDPTTGKYRDNPDFWDQDPYIRNMYWLIPKEYANPILRTVGMPEIEAAFLKVRKPQDWAWMGAIVQGGYKDIKDGYGSETAELFMQAVFGLLPLNSSSVPGALLDVSNNKIPNFGGELIPKSMEKVDKRYQYKPEQNQLLKAATDAYNNKMPKGMHISPIQMEAIVHALTARAATDILDITEHLLGMDEGRPTKRPDETILGRLTFLDLPTKYSFAERKLREMYEDPAKVTATINALQENLWMTGDITAYLNDPKNKHMLDAAPTLATGFEALNNLNKEMRTVYAAPDMRPDQKRAKRNEMLKEKSIIVRDLTAQMLARPEFRQVLRSKAESLDPGFAYKMYMKYKSNPPAMSENTSPEIPGFAEGGLVEAPAPIETSDIDILNMGSRQWANDPEAMTLNDASLEALGRIQVSSDYSRMSKEGDTNAQPVVNDDFINRKMADLTGSRFYKQAAEGDPTQGMLGSYEPNVRDQMRDFIRTKVGANQTASTTITEPLGAADVVGFLAPFVGTPGAVGDWQKTKPFSGDSLLASFGIAASMLPVGGAARAISSSSIKGLKEAIAVAKSEVGQLFAARTGLKLASKEEKIARAGLQELEDELAKRTLVTPIITAAKGGNEITKFGVTAPGHEKELITAYQTPGGKINTIGHGSFDSQKEFKAYVDNAWINGFLKSSPEATALALGLAADASGMTEEGAGAQAGLAVASGSAGIRLMASKAGRATIAALRDKMFYEEVQKTAAKAKPTLAAIRAREGIDPNVLSVTPLAVGASVDQVYDTDGEGLAVGGAGTAAGMAYLLAKGKGKVDPSTLTAGGWPNLRKRAALEKQSRKYEKDLPITSNTRNLEFYHGTRRGPDAVESIRRDGFKEGSSAELYIPGTSISEDFNVSMGFADQNTDGMFKITLDPKEITHMRPSEYLFKDHRDNPPKFRRLPQSYYHEKEIAAAQSSGGQSELVPLGLSVSEKQRAMEQNQKLESAKNRIFGKRGALDDLFKDQSPDAHITEIANDVATLRGNSGALNKIIEPLIDALTTRKLRDSQYNTDPASLAKYKDLSESAGYTLMAQQDLKKKAAQASFVGRYGDEFGVRGLSGYDGVYEMDAGDVVRKFKTRAAAEEAIAAAKQLTVERNLDGTYDVRNAYGRKITENGYQSEANAREKLEYLLSKQKFEIYDPKVFRKEFDDLYREYHTAKDDTLVQLRKFERPMLPKAISTTRFGDKLKEAFSKDTIKLAKQLDEAGVLSIGQNSVQKNPDGMYTVYNKDGKELTIHMDGKAAIESMLTDKGKGKKAFKKNDWIEQAYNKNVPGLGPIWHDYEAYPGTGLKPDAKYTVKLSGGSYYIEAPDASVPISGLNLEKANAMAVKFNKDWDKHLAKEKELKQFEQIPWEPDDMKWAQKPDSIDQAGKSFDPSKGYTMYKPDPTKDQVMVYKDGVFIKGGTTESEATDALLDDNILEWAYTHIDPKIPQKFNSVTNKWEKSKNSLLSKALDPPLKGEKKLTANQQKEANALDFWESDDKETNTKGFVYYKLKDDPSYTAVQGKHGGFINVYKNGQMVNLDPWPKKFSDINDYLNIKSSKDSVGMSKMYEGLPIGLELIADKMVGYMIDTLPSNGKYINWMVAGEGPNVVLKDVTSKMVIFPDLITDDVTKITGWEVYNKADKMYGVGQTGGWLGTAQSLKEAVDLAHAYATGVKK